MPNLSFHFSLIFQNQAVGETWYKLNLTSETPAPTVCPHMECELGKWSRQFISLTNPTQETLILVPTNSNTNNFTLEIEQDKTVRVLEINSYRKQTCRPSNFFYPLDLHKKFWQIVVGQFTSGYVEKKVR